MKNRLDKDQIINIPKLINFGIINLDEAYESYHEYDLEIPDHAFYILMEKLPIDLNHINPSDTHFESLEQQLYNLNYVIKRSHNDIRPQNIIVSRDRAYLIDFSESSECNYEPIYNVPRTRRKRFEIRVPFDLARLKRYQNDLKEN
ncbi:hypothetical protein BN7_6283 [Wickerhamomyces ciferrii]|uniref:Protein kinase domain-containing protein n=1 Tax=Wickerhamomyces ciferrii (strain ATCC 14091 / BCRC 22168 / CBS 111 / JCM 3599 / NBRC 0793 / NRRL Y-1031 F-60-10) TaxID=1206466 RepID=K0KU27_WICCF|nr:uncharacterized protein BN7_6283 [Wickerhamomyces ciferrii]CCH46686.1 hypothetical protein BN7_6283 [Wickerhamomyces ciferrii]